MNFFKSIAKAAFETVLLPVEVIKDAATLGGSLTDQKTPYTAQRLKAIDEDLQKAADSLDDGK